MIIVITYLDRKTGKRIVDYGINIETDEKIVLPNVPIDYFPNLSYDGEVGEFLLKN